MPAEYAPAAMLGLGGEPGPSERVVHATLQFGAAQTVETAEEREVLLPGQVGIERGRLD